MTQYLVWGRRRSGKGLALVKRRAKTACEGGDVPRHRAHKMVREDSRWASSRLTLVCLGRRHDNVDAEVMLRLGQFVIYDLKLMDGRHNAGLHSDQTSLSEQRDLDIRVSRALADPGS